VPTESYVIRGGREGRERLRILSEVMGAATGKLLDDAGITPGSACVDLGCGGGDVSFELSRRVGQTGRVLGVDRDEAKVAIARSEAREQGLTNAEFRVADLTEWKPDDVHDAAYARFLFSHIADPARLLATVRGTLRPGGTVIIEDVDFHGHFSEPPCPALDSYVGLYLESVARRGGNAIIGPLLPALLRDAGFDQIQVRVSHPVAMLGGIKTLTCMTLESISEAVRNDGLISESQLRELTEDLRVFAANPETILGGPRVFQVIGKARR
jgi:SAM-dependent methyltransferase